MYVYLCEGGAAAGSAALVLFWQNLPNAVISNRLTANKTDDTSGKTFQLPNGGQILGDDDLGDTMYLRPVHRKIYDKLKQKLMAKDKSRGILVVGTPGIGTLTNGARQLLMTLCCD